MRAIAVRGNSIRRMIEQAKLNTGNAGSAWSAGQHPGQSLASKSLHREILLPSEYDNDGRLEGAYHPVGLWRAALGKEHIPNAIVARRFTATLPNELSREQQIELAQTFAWQRANSDGSAADLEITEQALSNRRTVVSASFLFSTREVRPNGFGQKTLSERQTLAEQRQKRASEVVVSKEMFSTSNAWSLLKYRAVAAAEVRRRAVSKYEYEQKSTSVHAKSRAASSAAARNGQAELG